MMKKTILALPLLAAICFPAFARASRDNTLSEQEKADGWQLLWDGKTTEGWRSAKGDTFPKKGWVIRDGMLTVLKSDGSESRNGGDIVTTKQYRNFILSVDFKITEGANSGIKYFVQTDLNKGEGSAIGCEYQILDDLRHPDAKLGVDGNRTLGSLYDMIKADKDKAGFDIKTFNTALIRVDGNKVTHWLNGVKILEYERNTQQFNALVACSKYRIWPGFGNFEKGHILLQDHGDRVSFKNIKIKELPDGRGSEGVKIGIAGYSYHKFDIDHTLGCLRDMGVKYLSVKDFWLPLDSTVEQMEKFKEKCRSYGVEGYILGPIYMRSEAEVDRAFDYAQRYGATMFIGVPNYELLPYTIRKVKKTGIRVAIHTHGPDGAAFPDIRTIVEKVGDPTIGIGCCMDIGHSVRNGMDAAADIVTYKDWIYDIHIKDETQANKDGWTWEMGRGIIDFKAVLQALKDINYNGVISIEFEKNSDNPHTGIAESVGYLRAACDMLSGR